MCSIGGRLRSLGVSLGGAVSEIPPIIYFGSNPWWNEGDSACWAVCLGREPPKG